MEKNSKNNFKKILIGVSAGVISGLFTAGGGLILVPAFMYMLKINYLKEKIVSEDFYILYITNGNNNCNNLFKK